MEDNTARMNEIEEIETVDEVAEVSEDSNAGAFVAGIVGGFLAYAVIGGAKKLAAFIGKKLEDRRNTRKPVDLVEVWTSDVEEAQSESDEETENK